MTERLKKEPVWWNLAFHTKKTWESGHLSSKMLWNLCVKIVESVTAIKFQGHCWCKKLLVPGDLLLASVCWLYGSTHKMVFWKIVRFQSVWVPPVYQQKLAIFGKAPSLPASSHFFAQVSTVLLKDPLLKIQKRDFKSLSWFIYGPYGFTISVWHIFVFCIKSSKTSTTCRCSAPYGSAFWASCVRICAGRSLGSAISIIRRAEDLGWWLPTVLWTARDLLTL